MSDIRFGTDGWRGVIAEEFTFAAVRLAARAIGRRVRAEAGDGAAVLVGYDTRFLSWEFARAAAESLAAEGVSVALADRFAPTPALSYAVVERKATCAVVITASHNPARYNGLKIKAAFGGSAPLAFTRAVEEEIDRICTEDGVRSRQPEGGPPLTTHHSPLTRDECRTRSCGSGTRSADPHSAFRIPHSDIASFDPVAPWLDRLERFVDMARIGGSGVRVVLDVMYGAGQGFLAERLRRAGCRVEELHAEINPGFGGLHPEPIPQQLGGLSARMRDGRDLRVGFAFDGDSDRIAPVDETGRVVTPHETLALLLRHLAEHRGERGAVVRSLNIGRMVDREATRLGLSVTVTPIGFKYIAERMQAQDAMVGGEESGGFAVRGHIPERDPGLIALLLLECLAVTGRSLGELVGELEARYGPHRYRRLDLTLGSLAERDRVVAALRAAPPAAIQGMRVTGVEPLDGIRLDREDGSWVMLRASGTEPLLRIYAEAGSESAVDVLLEWGRGLTAPGV